MKKNDIALLILIISISAAAAYFIGNAIVGEPDSKVVNVESVELITPEITDPNPQVFNEKAINPTVPTKIGAPSNQQPFNGN